MFCWIKITTKFAEAIKLMREKIIVSDVLTGKQTAIYYEARYYLKYLQFLLSMMNREFIQLETSALSYKLNNKIIMSLKWTNTKVSLWRWSTTRRHSVCSKTATVHRSPSLATMSRVALSPIASLQTLCWAALNLHLFRMVKSISVCLDHIFPRSLCLVTVTYNHSLVSFSLFRDLKRRSLSNNERVLSDLERIL